jgi:hypothetical protein
VPSIGPGRSAGAEEIAEYALLAGFRYPRPTLQPAQPPRPLARHSPRSLEQAWRSSSRRWQTLEGKVSPDPTAEASLKALVRAIVALPVAYDDWQILYRKALQLGRALEGRPQQLSALVRREPPRGSSGPGRRPLRPTT